MLTVGQNHNVKFKVNVMGTSTEPRVRVILGTVPELSFVANKDQDDWASNLSIPAHIAPGDYEMRVEVHLNNRLFTPIKKNVSVKGLELPEPLKAASTPIEPNETPVLAKVEKIKAPDMPKVQAKLPDIEPKAKTVDEAELAAAILSTPAPLLGALEKLSKAPAAPMRKRFESKKEVPASPIRVSISEIDAVTSSKVSHVIEACKPVKVSRKASKGSSIVKLVKEHLFYE